MPNTIRFIKTGEGYALRVRNGDKAREMSVAFNETGDPRRDPFRKMTPLGWRSVDVDKEKDDAIVLLETMAEVLGYSIAKLPESSLDRWHNAVRWAQTINGHRDAGRLVTYDNAILTDRVVVEEDEIYIQLSPTCRQVIFRHDPESDDGSSTPIDEWNRDHRFFVYERVDQFPKEEG